MAAQVKELLKAQLQVQRHMQASASLHLGDPTDMSAAGVTMYVAMYVAMYVCVHVGTVFAYDHT